MGKAAEKYGQQFHSFIVQPSAFIVSGKRGFASALEFVIRNE
jgi:hypothetical protein